MRPDPITMSAGNGYYYSFKLNQDGSYGVDYFDEKGNPISNAQFDSRGAGITSGQLENAASQGFRSYDEWLLNNGGKTSAGATDPGMVTHTADAEPTPPTDTTTGGDPAPTFTTHWVNGVAYNDPVSYTNAVTEAVMKAYNASKKQLDSAYQSGLLDFKTYQDNIVSARESAKQQYGDALSSISGQFSAMSPDAIQSSQAGRENRATDINNQNMSGLSTAEADLGQRRAQYDIDYANNLEANTMASQNQIDTNLTKTAADIDGTPYANSMSKINSPIINTVNPMGDQVSGVYDAAAAQFKAGNMPAMKQTIDSAQVDPNIKDWLYTRFKQNV